MSVRKQDASGMPLLGSFIYWRTSSFKQDYEDFLNLLREVGITTEIARATLPKHALIRAIKDTARTAGRNRFHRKTIEHDDRAAFSIARTDIVDEEEMDVSYASESKIIFDKKNKNVKIEGEYSEDLNKKYSEYQNFYTEKQFRSVVLRYVKKHCEAVSMLDQGGLYFVPADKQEELDKLEALFHKLPDAHLAIIPQFDSKKAKKEIWSVMISEAHRELQKLSEDFESLDDEVTDKVVGTRLQRYKKLKTKIEMYELALSSTAEDLKEGISKLTDLIKRKKIV